MEDARAREGYIQAVDEILLSDLTHDEAAAFLAGAARRAPWASFTPRADGDGVATVVDAAEWVEARELLDGIVAQGTPPRLRMRRDEAEIARLVGAILASHSFAYERGSPMGRLCLLLEHRLVPLVLEADVVDGFLPEDARPRDGGLALAGVCWWFTDGARGMGKGAFEAEFAVDAAGVLASLRLRFGAPQAFHSADLSFAVETTERLGYNVATRGTRSAKAPSFLITIDRVA